MTPVLKKKWFLQGLALLLLFSLLALILFSQRDSYSKISDIHIQQLSEKEQIEILDVAMRNELDRPFAYVYYKRGVKVGAYYISVINDKLVYGMDFMLNEDTGSPVQVFGIRTGYPYLMIQINDVHLLQEGNQIYATFNQTKWHRLDIDHTKRNYMITGDNDEASKGRSSVQIYNADHELIF
ncbi:hypothetical protein HMSSN139_09240 [Paenibacillus sp. HMSSN-139]|nr:hypothetical protein HMSSN139_09240 [Paenibacillus sp. HMSSN-139]